MEAPPPAGASGCGSWWKPGRVEIETMRRRGEKKRGKKSVRGERGGGSSCFLPVTRSSPGDGVNSTSALIHRDAAHGISCFSFQTDASDVNLILTPRSLKSLAARVIHPVTAEPSLLPFSDIKPRLTSGVRAFTLESGQRSSGVPLDNCVCSFKGEAENVSLCARSAVP